ncbi:MAG: PD40 domain-containing protein, partial [Deltaproteobacteria bacterium]|nr:PD40 domain-containing protein [Deltaproteobacteria bacterium]
MTYTFTGNSYFKVLISASLIILLYICPSVTEAKVYIDINSVGGKKLPIAVQELVRAKPLATESPGALAEAELIERLNEEIYATLIADLKFSGIFDYIERDAYLEDLEDSGVTARKTDFGLWRAIGTEILIKGGFNVHNGKLTAEFRLFDAVKETQLIARRYISNETDPKSVAHKFIDDVLKRLTGVKGIFSTKIMYLKGQGVSKDVFLSDYDGTRPIRLTDNNSINLSPNWSPKGDQFIYTSYMGDNPALYMQDIQSGKVTVISNRQGINIGGRWSPNGRQVALTISGKKSPELIVKPLNSRSKGKELTKNHAIDVSPTWSPDGRLIYYISDIAGNPHIYVINSKGGKSRRITYKGTYHAT